MVMKEDKLGDLSMKLSVEILKLTKELRSKKQMKQASGLKCFGEASI